MDMDILGNSLSIFILEIASYTMAENNIKVASPPNQQLNFYQKEDQVLLAVDCIIFGFEKKVSTYY